MRRILVLTKNILVEKTFQQKLQHLNYEVFCTNCCEETIEHELTFFNYFDAIVLSETLSQNDCLRLLGSLSSLEKPIYRRSQSMCNKREAEIWQERGIIRWLGLKDSLEDIREKIDTVDQSFAEVTAELLDDQVKKIRFTKNEQRFLKILYQHAHEGLDRDQICRLLWQKEPDASTKSQLSFVCKRVKQKFSDAGMNEEIITTSWGKGYQINEQILPYLEQTLFETAQ